MKFYRFYEQKWARPLSFDVNGCEIYDSLPGRVTLEIEVCPLIKETPCGHWIETFKGKRWVNKTSAKRYAYPTKEEALFGFIKRKQRQIKILKSQLDAAETGLRLAEKEAT